MSSTVLLGDTAVIYDAKRKPLNSRERAERKGKYPYYGASDVVDHINDYLFDGEYVLIAEDGENLRSRKTPIAFKADGKFWVNNHAHVLQGKESWINDFIVSYFRYLDLSPYLTGAAQPKLNQESLLRIPITWPSDAFAKKLAEISSSFDEKIELNRRMNKTLEEIGQALFKNMFVDNQEKEKWPVGKLEDLFNIVMGQSPPGSSYNELGEGVIFYQGRAGFGERFPTNRLYTTKPKRLARDGDILLSVRAPVGDINQASEDCCVGRGLAAIRQKDDFLTFGYYFLNSLRFRFNEFNDEGTVFGAINGKQLKNLVVAVPPIELIEKFEVAAGPNDELIRNNSEEISTSVLIRDSILPRLMSARINL